jgi:hypothetical protein
LTFRRTRSARLCWSQHLTPRSPPVGRWSGSRRGAGQSAALLATWLHERILGEPLGYQCGIVDEDQRVWIETEPPTHRWKLTSKACEAPQHLLGARHSETGVCTQPVPNDCHGLGGFAAVCLGVLPADVRTEFQVRVLLRSRTSVTFSRWRRSPNSRAPRKSPSSSGMLKRGRRVARSSVVRETS